jgi:putative transposase
MKRSRYSDEQIAYAVRQAKTGTAVADVCRQLGIGDATFYVWKKKYANLGATVLCELRLRRLNLTTPLDFPTPDSIKAYALP